MANPRVGVDAAHAMSRDGSRARMRAAIAAWTSHLRQAAAAAAAGAHMLSWSTER